MPQSKIETVLPEKQVAEIVVFVADTRERKIERSIQNLLIHMLVSVKSQFSAILMLAQITESLSKESEKKK